MIATIVRHGEVEKDYIGCYNGHNSIGLSKKGEEQAKAIAKKLSSKKFDAVFCSDLFRAKETIKYFSHVKDIIYTDKLREKSWGKHEGLSFDKIISQGEVEYIDFLQWIKSLDGEPYEEYVKRVEEFFMDYLPTLNKKEILIVTHAGVIRSLLSKVKNITLEEAFATKIEHGSFVVYDSEKGDFIHEDI